MNNTNKQRKKAIATTSSSIQVRTIQAALDLSLAPNQIPHFRGALLEKAGREADLLHNHDGETGYHHRYPLVHYRVHRGQALLLGLGELGVDAVRSLLLAQKSIRRGETQIPLRIHELKEKTHTVKMTDTPIFYRIYDYVPFTSDNYGRWQESEHLTARIELLEKVLTGHIISLANAMDFRMDTRLEVRLMTIREMRTVRLHDIPVLGFNIIFKANIQLPPYLALGRGVSFGFGVIKPTRT